MPCMSGSLLSFICSNCESSLVFAEGLPESTVLRVVVEECYINLLNFKNVPGA